MVGSIAGDLVLLAVPGGFLIAAPAPPQGMGGVRAARANQRRRAVNLYLGLALATVGLTVPAVPTVGRVTGKPVELALEGPDIVMPAVMLIVGPVISVCGGPVPSVASCSWRCLPASSC